MYKMAVFFSHSLARRSGRLGSHVVVVVVATAAALIFRHYLLLVQHLRPVVRVPGGPERLPRVRAQQPLALCGRQSPVETRTDDGAQDVVREVAGEALGVCDDVGVAAVEAEGDVVVGDVGRQALLQQLAFRGDDRLVLLDELILALEQGLVEKHLDVVPILVVDGHAVDVRLPPRRRVRELGEHHLLALRRRLRNQTLLEVPHLDLLVLLEVQLAEAALDRGDVALPLAQRAVHGQREHRPLAHADHALLAEALRPVRDLTPVPHRLPQRPLLSVLAAAEPLGPALRQQLRHAGALVAAAGGGARGGGCLVGFVQAPPLGVALVLHPVEQRAPRLQRRLVPVVRRHEHALPPPLCVHELPHQRRRRDLHRRRGRQHALVRAAVLRPRPREVPAQPRTQAVGGVHRLLPQPLGVAVLEPVLALVHVACTAAAAGLVFRLRRRGGAAAAAAATQKAVPHRVVLALPLQHQGFGRLGGCGGGCAAARRVG
eukprot:Rhum_TRINITY_DN10087_c0_g1::Rhum_TRINITY_DN10087_c0_g1_i1::g.36739::m.36739